MWIANPKLNFVGSWTICQPNSEEHRSVSKTTRPPGRVCTPSSVYLREPDAQRNRHPTRLGISIARIYVLSNHYLFLVLSTDYLFLFLSLSQKKTNFRINFERVASNFFWLSMKTKIKQKICSIILHDQLVEEKKKLSRPDLKQSYLSLPHLIFKKWYIWSSAALIAYSTSHWHFIVLMFCLMTWFKTG